MPKESYVSICINPVTKKYVYVPASTVVIKVVDGKEYTVKNLLEDIDKLQAKADSTESCLNELVSKFNALLAAYKANTAKTAMELLDMKENN